MNLSMSKWINGLASMRERRIHEALWQRFSVTPAVNNAVTWAEGTSVPTAALAGYAPGCKFILSNATLGQCMEWTNYGTASSCAFYPTGPVIGYGAAYGGSNIATAGGDTTEYIDNHYIRLGDLSFVEHHTTNDTDVIVEQKPTANGRITVVASVDPSTAHGYNYIGLREGLTPAWDIVAAGTRVAIAGDTTSVPITVTGVQAGDIAFATIVDTNDTDSVNAVVCTTNTVTLTVSADPVTDHTWNYVVFRPRGDFRPSHYIAYAGEYTAVAGDTTTVAITVTGALATDIAIVHWATSDDTDTLTKAVLTDDTLTLTVSADPVTDHSWAYMILREY